MVEDWGLYRVFLEVARAGSMRKAQDALGLTQPTIGLKLDELEQSIGSKLLFRTRTGISLTDMGQRVMATAQEIERLNSRTMEEVRENTFSACLKLALTDSQAGYWFLLFLNKFYEQYPDIRLHIRCIDPGQVMDLTRGEVDLQTVYVRPIDPDAVILAEVTVTVLPICHKSYADKYGLPKDMEDILDFPVCALDAHYWEHNESVRPWAEMLNRHPNVVYRTNAGLPLGAVTRAGYGISLQPIGVVDAEPDLIALDWFVCNYQLYLVCHKDKKDYPPVRALIDLFKQHVFNKTEISLARTLPDKILSP